MLLQILLNGETDPQTGPHTSDFSTNIGTMIDWMNTAHMHARTSATFVEKILLTNGSRHRECHPTSLRLHYNLEEALHQQRSRYRNMIRTRKHLIKVLIDADIIGEKAYNVLVQKRPNEGRKNFMDPIR